jgi:UDP-2-acetamido-3-amino-2,3-dideoxy-glucuronate N-acetyltransferase
MTGLPENAIVHETAVVDDGAILGEGTRIWHFCHIMSGAVLGRECTLGQNVFVAAGVRLGDSVKVQNNVSLYAGVECEDNVFLGPSMVFTNVINPRSHVDRREEFQRTLVERGATVGANATIVCGITLGRYSFIGAGSVVTHDVPAHGLVYGVPARLKGHVCSCGINLEFDTPLGTGPDEVQCPSCDAHFVKDEAGSVARVSP